MSQTLLFLGATGGVTNACLISALMSNQYKAIALVRTPEKLLKQLAKQPGLEENIINSNLTIIQGNALDVSDVKRALLANVNAHTDTVLPSMILSGLGGGPALNLDIWHPLQIAKLDNPTICEDAAKTLITALQEVYSEQPSLRARKPGACFVSTTGISRGPEDVPFGMQFLYHQVLALPHADKRKMEATFRDHMLQSGPVFTSVTGIRPTLLKGTGALNEGMGIEKLRVGTESKPATGFIVQRADVGAWMFENVVKEGEGGKWRGEMVSLTS